ncbi:glycosyltransferase family 2 protein [Cohnella rhizosphaerae]|uniref:Glycosyltransferase family 2 protein n=1 Tax=Cohnella rhizosphaerae TaxID=1457232 RepID=A0A9X4L690_9BACL|nr:glycosyltransferase family 2 protein [Cohnella rhizosphaerae]MDG0814674.1 glycosyltransferase family 2 protein [Cohnella rhizosphaerae]
MVKYRASRGGRRVVRQRSRRRRTIAREAPGYQDGHENGYREGVQAGLASYDTIFDGTSIIIPTFNQRELLAKCINSIVRYTEPAYEIIVVDNGSTDGTAEYLARLGAIVRHRVLERNLGFAGACNIGLMMAKGRTLMLLNNDTLVTENWLENLLACLKSDADIGMVGPVTNFISGEQQIQVPYTDIHDMQSFASRFNRHDPNRWRNTDRLVGFCVLMQRETFLKLGYLDEGFELGNFEDDDWDIRVRLLGQRLVIAGDTFIHHFGSVSIRALGDGFQRVHSANERYYLDKWRGWQRWSGIVASSSGKDGRDGSLGLSELFPSGVAVRVGDADVYWVEGGKRRLVAGVLPIEAVKLSRVDLRRWPIGEPIEAQEALERWHAGVVPVEGKACAVALLPDGTAYHLEGDTARPLLGSAALKSWNLHLKPMAEVSETALEGWRQGAPIIALPKLLQAL